MQGVHSNSVSPWRRGYPLLLGSTVLAVALADWLFYGHPVGWTAGLFAAFVLVLLAIRGGAFLHTGPGLAVLLAAGGMVAALIEEPTALSLGMSTLLTAMLAVLNRNAWPGGARQWSLRLADSIGTSLTRVATDHRVVLRRMRRRPVSADASGRWVAAWTLPLVLGAVFVALFREANPIISRVVASASGRLGEMLRDVTDVIDPPRNVFWLCAAVVIYALLRAGRSSGRWRFWRSAQSRQLDSGNADESAAGAESLAGGVTHYSLAPRGVSATGIVVRCLLVFNALFAVQNVLDLAYLFGGATLPDGMTHAEYAHRGAYPLVATAVLAAVFVLAAFRPGGAAEQSALARRLVYAWVAQNVFLTVTAAWRLDLYVEVYSLTRMRVAAGLWMLLVATGLVWIGCRIVFRRDNAWLLNANVLSALAVLYACCFVNVDRVIADYNVAHCRESGAAGVPIDLNYLHSLGPDALPALRRVTPALETQARRRSATAYAAALRTELDDQLSDWRGWTLRRWRTRAASES